MSDLSGFVLRKGFSIDLILLEFLVEVLPGYAGHFGCVGDVPAGLGKNLLYVSLFEGLPSLL